MQRGGAVNPGNRAGEINFRTWVDALRIFHASPADMRGKPAVTCTDRSF